MITLYINYAEQQHIIDKFVEKQSKSFKEQFFNFFVLNFEEKL